MRGAIPYYRIRESRSVRKAESGSPGPESLGRVPVLLCDMAHHVNNLLMRIQGYTSLLLMDMDPGKTGFERLKLVENYIAYGGMLTSQLLACAGRGVYSDPVNIPPLLLKSQDETGWQTTPCAISSRLFVVGGQSGQIQPGYLGICRDISLKMEGLFKSIGDAVLKGRHLRDEKEYLARIRSDTGEGAQLARNIAAVFNTARVRQTHRQQPNSLRPPERAPDVIAGLEERPFR